MIDAVLKIDSLKNFTHVFKLDEYTVIEKSNSINFEKIDTSSDYSGSHILDLIRSCGARFYHFFKVSKSSHWNNHGYRGDFVPYANGGAGYCLSRNAMLLINKKVNRNSIEEIREKHIYEDVMIGLILFSQNIHPVRTEVVVQDFAYNLRHSIGKNLRGFVWYFN